MNGEGGTEAVLGLYPSWWRARYGDEVRAVSSDAVAGGQSRLRVIVGLIVGAIRLRVTGTGTPKQVQLWANRTRACILAATVPALVMLPLLFLTFKLRLRDNLPPTPSTVLSSDGRVAYDALQVMALAGILVMGIVIRGSMILVGRRKGGRVERRVRRAALIIVGCALLTVVAVTAGLVPIFTVVAVGVIVWGSVTAARAIRQRGPAGRALRHLVPVPGLLAGLAVVGWIGSNMVGPHQFLDSRGMDVPLDGHPALAHGLVVAAATAIGLAWMATFTMLAVVANTGRPCLKDLQAGRGFGVAASALLWAMATAAIVSEVALGRQPSLHLPASRVIVTSWGHLWAGGGPALIIAATVSTVGAIAAERSWRVTAQLAR